MNLLTQAQQSRLAMFLSQQARPLERERFKFLNGQLPNSQVPNAGVIAELAKFQNADGGFGHALEPDIRLADSSVIATSVAFQILREVNVDPADPMVQRACNYLKTTFDGERLNWPIIPPNIDDAPHAPWWSLDSDLLHSLANPRAELLGYCYEYAIISATDREALTQAVVATLAAHTEDMEMHDFLCYLRLWETPRLPTALTAQIAPRLAHLATKVVSLDRASWAGYGLQPLGVIGQPESPLAAQFTAALEDNLDYLIETLGDSDCWQPAWSWDFVDALAWHTAHRDWCGVLTFNNWRTLKQFGRMGSSD